MASNLDFKRAKSSAAIIGVAGQGIEAEAKKKKTQLNDFEYVSTSAGDLAAKGVKLLLFAALPGWNAGASKDILDVRESCFTSAITRSSTCEPYFLVEHVMHLLSSPLAEAQEARARDSQRGEGPEFDRFRHVRHGQSVVSCEPGGRRHVQRLRAVRRRRWRQLLSEGHLRHRVSPKQPGFPGTVLFNANFRSLLSGESSLFFSVQCNGYLLCLKHYCTHTQV